ncbi:MAG: hypothetical protein KF696_15990 [Planctomycetes bacterium]|nr:hypothetical protein [Planctomycetota bacterium]MCW8136925.1 hypothetical protein [Planctomycetota bacterium]
MMAAGEFTLSFNFMLLLGGIACLTVGTAIVIFLVLRLRKREPAMGDPNAWQGPAESAEPQFDDHTPLHPELPVSDTPGSARPSEQTIKRMTVEQVTAMEAAKGPRASDVDGNPILPDSVVKVLCLNCNKRMRADGAKFAKQRRCPNCKATPFRFVIVPERLAT